MIVLLSAEYWCRNGTVLLNQKIQNSYWQHIHGIQSKIVKLATFTGLFITTTYQQFETVIKKMHYFKNLLNPKRNGGHQVPFRSLISRQEWSILPMVVLMQVSRELSQAGGEALEASGVMRGSLSPRVPSTAVTCSLSAGIINKSKNCLLFSSIKNTTYMYFYFII